VIAGHYGLAVGAKATTPGAPLWALLLATQWLDLFFVPLYLAGVETAVPLDPAAPNAYGGAVIHADYTHSLVGALLLAALAGLLARWRWGPSVGAALAAVAFSHWLLDLVVHRADLPLLPGNAGGLPLLGLGLWRWPAVSATVELLLVLGGAALYYRAATRLPPGEPPDGAAQRRRVLTASAVVTLLMLLSLLANVLGLG
jgi:membrane-bound metal-dependent hydrolase YbcI (DUF457 family)